MRPPLGVGKGERKSSGTCPPELQCPCAPRGCGRMKAAAAPSYRQARKEHRGKRLPPWALSSAELAWGCSLPLLERWLPKRSGSHWDTSPSLQNHTVLPRFHCPHAQELFNCILCTLFSLHFCSNTSNSLIR